MVGARNVGEQQEQLVLYMARQNTGLNSTSAALSVIVFENG